MYLLHQLKQIRLWRFIIQYYNFISFNGLYNASNLYAAITIGKYFEVEDLSNKEALELYSENNRSQLLTKGSNDIILDAYNANPSMTVAIENFIQIQD
jgi:UDP-N-acetylmuramoyl-tripeptide--D-alanyl-D-alanine ligase